MNIHDISSVHDDTSTRTCTHTHMHSHPLLGLPMHRSAIFTFMNMRNTFVQHTSIHQYAHKQAVPCDYGNIVLNNMTEQVQVSGKKCSAEEACTFRYSQLQARKQSNSYTVITAAMHTSCTDAVIGHATHVCFSHFTSKPHTSTTSRGAHFWHPIQSKEAASQIANMRQK